MSTIKTAFETTSNVKMELVIDNNAQALELHNLETGKVVKFKSKKIVSTLMKHLSRDDVRHVSSLIAIHGDMDMQMAMMTSM